MYDIKMQYVIKHRYSPEDQRKISAGPIVISIYNKDGGYLLVFTNERISKIRPLCLIQGSGSP
jgi:hypothetical protein